MHDLATTATYDLVPNYAGGLTTADGYDIDYADVNYRVLTNNPDHQLWPVGANLEDLTGKPNTPATGSMGVASILQALTFDGRFKSTGLSVTAVPLDLNTIQFFIGVTNTAVRTTVPYLTTVVNL